MKSIFFSVFLLMSFSNCNRKNDDVTIERHEDYESNDVRDKRNLPLETEDEVEVDRDVMSDD